MRKPDSSRPPKLEQDHVTWPPVDSEDIYGVDAWSGQQTLEQRLRKLEATHHTDTARLVAVEKRLKRHEQLIQQLLGSGFYMGDDNKDEEEEEEASVESALPPDPAPQKRSNTRHGCSSVHYKNALELVREDPSYTVAESVWDVLLLTWSPCVGLGSSVLVSLAFLLNVSMQLTCSFVAWFTLAQSGNFVTNKAVTVAKMWRISEAHSRARMDEANWMSLARRVCEIDGTLVLGTSQALQIKEIENYFRAMPPWVWLNVGGALSVVCITIFGLVIANEVINCILFLEALLNIPRNFHRTSVTVDGEALTLITVSVWRVAFMLGVVLIRIWIALTLLVAGGWWLSNTSQLGDLLLNCAALAFVLELDEILYKSLVPELVKGIISRLRPVPLQKECVFRGLNVRPLLVLVACSGYVAWMFFDHVQPMQKRMVEVKQAMCHGAKDFIVDVQPFLGMAVVGLTTVSNKSFNNTLLKRVTMDFASPNNPYGHNWSTDEKLQEFVSNMKSNPPAVKRGLYKSSAWLAGGMQEFQHHLRENQFPFTGCQDVLPMTQRLGDGGLLTLEYATGKFGVDDCADFTGFCAEDTQRGELVRAYCSKTCRCDSFNFMPVVRNGCSFTCTASLRLEQTYNMWDGSVLSHFADCIDYYDPLFFNATASEEYFTAFEQYNYVSYGAIPRQLFAEHGCDALDLASSLVDEWHGKIWLIDKLCGRFTYTTLAIRKPDFVTLRARCPVACGCTLDIAGGCPDSCKFGAGARAVDACSLGLCQHGTVLNATRMLGAASWHGATTCGLLDGVVRNGTSSRECELQQANHRAHCCDVAGPGW